jgi:hypothetical protein
MHTRSLLFLIVAAPFLGVAQVGIGTNSPNTSAKLDVTSSNKGFLPPRVSLQGTDDATKGTPTIASPATGLLVYNIATAGSGVTAVTPGIYYYDGAKWQRAINQQPDATVSFNTTNPNPANSPTFDPPDLAANTNYIYVSSVDASQWTYNGSTYVTYTPPASTAWMLSGNTTDAGSNKSNAVFRTGSVAIGGTTSAPITTVSASAQLEVTSTSKGFLPPRMTTAQRDAITSPADGLIIYNTTNNRLELRSATASAWLTMTTLTGAVQKSVVSGYFNNSSYSQGLNVLACTKVNDVNNDFSANTFTAPRTGLYLVTVNLMTTNRDWLAAREEINIGPYNVSTGAAYFLGEFFAQGSVNTYGVVSSSCVISLTAGTQFNFKAFNTTGSYTLATSNYNQFSITEL